MLKLHVIPFSVLAGLLVSASTHAEEANSLDLSLQELMNVEVTSVSKQKQPLSNSPAAIYVLTNEAIRQSGATSIPQALRDVPGLHVAQLDSQKWAVSSRGFNGRYNNKLLVMIDGRTLYSPAFSGVYWEVQDVLMADVERIEVIRGPSAALWGANAVNGVINIITKHSADTLGGYAELGAGDYEQGFIGARYGTKLSDNTTSRMYIKGNTRDSLDHNPDDLDSSLIDAAATVDKNNDWRHLQLGGRVDIQLENDTSLTLSSDFYTTKMNQASNVATMDSPVYREFYSEEVESEGFNLLSRYTKALSATSEYTLQTYYDFADRDEEIYRLRTNTVDIDFQHQLIVGQDHNIVWGLGYRYINDDISASSILTSSEPDSTQTHLWSAFVSDEITILDDALWLTLASRFEHNDYTGFEVQPNIRLMWQVDSKNSVWTSIARAVRTPSRVENNLIVNALNIAPSEVSPLVKVFVAGNDDYQSEEIVSYEVGYRFVPAKKWSFDTTFFFNAYDKLRSTSDGTTDFSAFPNYLSQYTAFENQYDGYNYGAELSSMWAVTDLLQLRINYSYIQNEFGDILGQNTQAPQNMVSTMVDWNMTENIDVNIVWRFIDNTELLTGNGSSFKTIDGYKGVDIGIHWAATPDLMLSAFGKNLFYSSHLEYEAESILLPYQVGPSYFVKASVNF
ncbi:TonB-dependent receptor [Shewanella algicola]|uniref:TonB-dependent receptor n=1 Tax=Shewanella algicola TaxID=640633 RepID=A0A9X2CDS2_9GAMM|nr:TonB-dependent receptor [Shewanella algicola]MCL1105761.1 TonB-dependent receptor [Shewanella algicola]GGP55040.1 TonB-dependent receptor [Shewanella algicola]